VAFKAAANRLPPFSCVMFFLDRIHRDPFFNVGHEMTSKGNFHGRPDKCNQEDRHHAIGELNCDISRRQQTAFDLKMVAKYRQLLSKCAGNVLACAVSKRLLFRSIFTSTADIVNVIEAVAPPPDSVCRLILLCNSRRKIVPDKLWSR